MVIILALCKSQGYDKAHGAIGVEYLELAALRIGGRVMGKEEG